jgi:hypothetical protein
MSLTFFYGVWTGEGLVLAGERLVYCIISACTRRRSSWPKLVDCYERIDICKFRILCSIVLVIVQCMTSGSGVGSCTVHDVSHRLHCK